MKIILNGSEIRIKDKMAETLGEVLGAIQDEHLDAEKVIAVIRVDGEVLTSELFTHWRDKSAGEFGEIRIEAKAPNIIAANGLRSLAQAIQKSDASREEVVDYLCQGESNKAMSSLSEYLRIWEGTQETMASLCRLLNIEMDELEVPAGNDVMNENESVVERINQLSGQLQEIKGALESGDLVMLSDIMSYEFEDVSQDWQRTLGRLADRIENE